MAEAPVKKAAAKAPAKKAAAKAPVKKAAAKAPARPTSPLRGRISPRMWRWPRSESKRRVSACSS